MQKRGQEVFLTTTCASCHTIQGTNAGGRVGLNLTHIASQMRLGAGTLPNTKEHLGNWISDPQAVKPGARMPQNTYSSEDLQALTESSANPEIIEVKRCKTRKRKKKKRTKNNRRN